MPEIAYVNGIFLPLDQAVVSVEDRGLQFADSVYEVLRTYGGRPFAVADHFGRLFRSLAAIDLVHDFTIENLTTLVAEAVRRGGFAESVVYLQVTRGPAPRHRAVPAVSHPTLILTVRELRVSPHLRETGVSVITVPDERWGRCDIKSVGLLAYVLAYRAAEQAGAHDAVFVGADESVFEASAGNVFVLTGDRLVMPPTGPRLLSGVTRDKILGAARSLGIVCAEERIRRAELRGATEAFLTSTTHEVVPVVAVDQQRLGSGLPGPVAGRIYQEFVRSFAGG